jgi:hypothetical protein
MARTHWSRPAATRALDHAARHWTRPGFLRHAAALADLNLLAYALMAADRRSEARPLFEALGGVVTPWPWRTHGDPLVAFEQTRRKAADRR